MEQTLPAPWYASGDIVRAMTEAIVLEDQFAEPAPRLTDRFRVLGLTRRAHPPSDGAAAGYDWADMPTGGDPVQPPAPPGSFLGAGSGRAGVDGRRGATGRT